MRDVRQALATQLLLVYYVAPLLPAFLPTWLVGPAPPPPPPGAPPALPPVVGGSGHAGSGGGSLLSEALAGDAGGGEAAGGGGGATEWPWEADGVAVESVEQLELRTAALLALFSALAFVVVRRLGARAFRMGDRRSGTLRRCCAWLLHLALYAGSCAVCLIWGVAFTHARFYGAVAGWAAGLGLGALVELLLRRARRFIRSSL